MQYSFDGEYCWNGRGVTYIIVCSLSFLVGKNKRTKKFKKSKKWFQKFNLGCCRLRFNFPSDESGRGGIWVSVKEREREREIERESVCVWKKEKEREFFFRVKNFKKSQRVEDNHSNLFCSLWHFYKIQCVLLNSNSSKYFFKCLSCLIQGLSKGQLQWKPKYMLALESRYICKELPI